jgi:hypothetical protein
VPEGVPEGCGVVEGADGPPALPVGVDGATVSDGVGSGFVGAATASQSSRVGRVKLYSSSSST